MTADLFAEALRAHLVGDLHEAQRLYALTIEADPGHARARANLATTWLQQGRLEHGVDGLRRSLEIDPAQPVTLTNLGAALRTLGRTEEALDAYSRSLALDPASADTLSQYGALLEAAGRLDEAADAFARAAEVHPEPGPLRHAQGFALYRAGRPDEAIAALRLASELMPRAAEPLNDLGVALDESGRLDEAMQAFARALALKPDYPEALNNRGLLLCRMDRLSEALEAYNAALALKPDYAAAWLNRADAAAGLGRFADALDSVDRALALEPGSADAWSRRGDMLGYLRRLKEAEGAYAKAQDLEPGHARSLFHLAFPLLREGRYEEGLKVYENRWLGPMKTDKADLPMPLWLGETPVEGKTVLLHSEQGHGDTLMMLRYAPLLARRGARVIVSVQGPIESLAAEVEGVEAVIPHGQPLPPYDLHIPLMSLPYAFGTRLGSVPGEPYLRAPAAERARWAERLGPRRRPRIGLCWAGSAAQRDNRWRSLALARLQPLLGLDADVFALQTDMSEADRATLDASPVHDLSGELATYADTAAVMEEMDLIATVCTSAANLAGGLGRPALVMLSAMADWRWGLEPDSSPWYPTARLFRQTRIGAWDEVVARVVDAAKTELAGLTPG
jgi:tetratricopeptide (TPR) repeat protein